MNSLDETVELLQLRAEVEKLRAGVAQLEGEVVKLKEVEQAAREYMELKHASGDVSLLTIKADNILRTLLGMKSTS